MHNVLPHLVAERLDVPNKGWTLLSNLLAGMYGLTLLLHTL
jgi:hypothetical protein